MTEETKRRELFRDPDNGKIAGVCAGLAAYFGFETWLVRVAVASAIILTGFFGLPLAAYVIAIFILDKKPHEIPAPFVHEEHPVSVKTKIWQRGEPPRKALQDLRARFGLMEQRLRRIEGHVTSKQFQLKREINNL